MKTNDIETLIQTYAAAWSEPDDEKRGKLLDAVWSAGATYTDPVAHAANKAELHTLIAGFLTENPGAQFTLNGPIDSHHHHIRFYWTMNLANGTTLPGMDYGEVTPDGKLSKIIGFF